MGPTSENLAQTCEKIEQIGQPGNRKTRGSIMQRLPNTAQLLAFEATARHGSYLRAGEELALTHSAVHRQVAALEALLGVKLFDRRGRGIRLSTAGERYLRTVRQHLGELERGTLEIMRDDPESVSLDLGVVPTFATRWLLPRLPGFMRLHPDIQVNLHTRTRPFLFEDSGLHAAIHAGERPWPGCTGQRLMDETLIPVCAPGLLRMSPPLQPGNLLELPLLQQSTRPRAWLQWFEHSGISDGRCLRGPRYELFSMTIEAARLGLGVGLVPALMVESELRAGELINPCPCQVPAERAYFLIRPEGPASAALRRFEAWLQSQLPPSP
jgi:LysR family glycine cleavage system transcriptional activator